MAAINESMLTKYSMFEAFKAYLPEDHWNLIEWRDGKVHIHEGDHRMSMYGDRQMLINDVQEFRQFMGSHTFFGAKLTEKTEVLPVYSFVQKISYELYIYKKDIFKELRAIVSDCNTKLKCEILAMISYYFRAKEAQLEGNCELVQYERNTFDKLKKELTKACAKNIKIKSSPQNIKKVIEKFKAILPKNESDPDYAEIVEYLESYSKKLTVSTHSKIYQQWINGIDLNIKILNSFIETNSKWFHPEQNRLPIVRKFKDVQEEFVLVHELLSEMQKAGIRCKSIEDEILNLPELATWDSENTDRKLKDEGINNIKFVSTLINRSKRRAVYIPINGGGYCIRAVSALMEAIHDMVFVKTLLQDAEEEELKSLIGIINEAIDYLNQNCEETRFIKLEKVAEFKKFIATKQQEQIPRLLSSPKSLAYKVGGAFTAIDLTKEFQRLNYEKTFKDQKITNLSSEAIRLLQEEKTGRVLDTHAMFDALEICQLLCIWEMNEKLRDYVHSQKSCWHFWVKCKICEAEKQASKAALLQLLANFNLGNN